MWCMLQSVLGSSISISMRMEELSELLRCGSMLEILYPLAGLTRTIAKRLKETYKGSKESKLG